MLPACLAATRSVLKGAPRTLSFIATALSLLLGFLVYSYHTGQGLDPVEGAEVIARAPGPGVDPPGQSGCGMRCMGAWLARGTREGVQERDHDHDHGHGYHRYHGSANLQNVNPETTCGAGNMRRLPL